MKTMRYRVTGQAAQPSEDSFQVTGLRDVWSIIVEADGPNAAIRISKSSVEYQTRWTDRIVVDQLQEVK